LWWWLDAGASNKLANLHQSIHLSLPKFPLHMNDLRPTRQALAILAGHMVTQPRPAGAIKLVNWIGGFPSTPIKGKGNEPSCHCQPHLAMNLEEKTLGHKKDFPQKKKKKNPEKKDLKFIF